MFLNINIDEKSKIFYIPQIVGKRFEGLLQKVILGVLVLLAMSSGALARDTSSKQKVIVIVSALDYKSFFPSDVKTIVRYLNKILPDHKIIHITERTSFSLIPGLHKEVTESLSKQMNEQIISDYEVTHLIMMDHGKTNSIGKVPGTTFKFLGFFSEAGVSPTFKKIFSPLVGKFSDNAFVMMESCLTTCGSVATTQVRIKALMDYFKIKNGTIFGAYKQMAPHAFENGFRKEQIIENSYNPLYIGLAFVVGLSTQTDLWKGHDTYNLTTFGLATVAAYVGIQVVRHWAAVKGDDSDKINWGYLFRFKDSKIQKIFNLHPYRNQDELFLGLDPIKIKAELNSCSLLFH